MSHDAQQEERRVRGERDLLIARLEEVNIAERMSLLVDQVFRNVSPQTAQQQLIGLVGLAEMLAERLNPATRTTVAVKMVEAAYRLDSDVDLALRWH